MEGNSSSLFKDLPHYLLFYLAKNGKSVKGNGYGLLEGKSRENAGRPRKTCAIKGKGGDKESVMARPEMLEETYKTRIRTPMS